MRVLDLFSGIGGFSLGLEAAGMETVAFCEFEEFPQRVLRHHWPDVPIYPDVRELTSEQLADDSVMLPAWVECDCCEDYLCTIHGVHAYDCECKPIDEWEIGNPYFDGGPGIDLICGGFPCQPFSVAGHQRAQEDDRHLWPEMFRLIRECQPSYVIGENVSGLINLGLDEVCADLESEDYAVQSFVIPACAVGAPHRRDRVWIIAKRNGIRGYRRSDQQGAKRRQIITGNNNASNRDKPGLQKRKRKNTKTERPLGWSKLVGNGAGDTRPRMGGRIDGVPEKLACIAEGWIDGTWEDGHQRVSNGVPDRVARLKALGNAVVPQVVQVIGKAIMQEAS